MVAKNIIYEQPITESTRICLRLQHLFAQVEHHLQGESEWSSRAAITAILDILTIIDRPDLKNKLGNALTQHIMRLTQLKGTPNVDAKKTRQLLDELNDIADKLHNHKGRIANELRENEFLLAIQQRVIIPAGTCDFSSPAYHLWLNQSVKSRTKHLNQWFSQFIQLQDIIALLLRLTRDSAILQTKTATEGFYQTNLEPTVAYQLIRICLPTTIHLYPEISVGKHRLAIHFFELNPIDKSIQTKADVQFELACCKI